MSRPGSSTWTGTSSLTSTCHLSPAAIIPLLAPPLLLIPPWGGGGAFVILKPLISSFVRMQR